MAAATSTSRKLRRKTPPGDRVRFHPPIPPLGILCHSWSKNGWRARTPGLASSCSGGLPLPRVGFEPVSEGQRSLGACSLTESRGPAESLRHPDQVAGQFALDGKRFEAIFTIAQAVIHRRQLGSQVYDRQIHEAAASRLAIVFRRPNQARPDAGSLAAGLDRQQPEVSSFTRTSR